MERIKTLVVPHTCALPSQAPYSDESVSSMKKHAAAAHATALPVGAASYYYTLDNSGAAIPDTNMHRVAREGAGKNFVSIFEDSVPFRRNSGSSCEWHASTGHTHSATG